MAYIYKITNIINQKIYIGKTEFSIDKRFSEHCRDAFKKDKEKRPLYAAMRKYGIENFRIEMIEETDSPEEQEIYWIEYYGSFKNGYNATKGGDGKRYIDYDLIIAAYKEMNNINEVARYFNIHADTVSNILKSKEIEITSATEVNRAKQGKVINQYDLNGKFLKSFPSARAAAIELNKITSTSNGSASHISDVCRGKRKTAYGFIWKFSE